jgi:hypothetical protein
MRKWGILISAFYALFLLGLVVPGAIFLARGDDFSSWRNSLSILQEAYHNWIMWLLIAAVLTSQALLLFLSVDKSHKRFKPRSHILVSCAVSAVLTALLTTAVIWSLGVAMRGDKFFDFFDSFSRHFLVDEDYFVIFWLLIFWGTLWLLWAILFYFYFRNSSPGVTKVISWLLKGSVLELLIVVPCHVIVRRRHDCSAPAATSFGIATGLAIMLLSFGPSVLFLYKKRLDSYSSRSL